MGKRSISFYMAEEDERAFLTWLLQVPYLALYWHVPFIGPVEDLAIRTIEDFYEPAERSEWSEVLIRDLRIKAELVIRQMVAGEHRGWNRINSFKFPGLRWLRSRRKREDDLEVIQDGILVLGLILDHPSLPFSMAQLMQLLEEVRRACFKSYTKHTFIPRWSVWIGPEARRLAELGQAGLEVPGGQGEQRWIKLKS